jgi:hypothetical protein
LLKCDFHDVSHLSTQPIVVAVVKFGSSCGPQNRGLNNAIVETRKVARRQDRARVLMLNQMRRRSISVSQVMAMA